ncbi:DinB family protein [Arenibacter sp. S6351L]|uniref:DinB family protein n=1 Tax=Arenibacter sp. S6351L TaxID=2926407 RepID=UPI001FF1C3A4|nr:DinB family protein [Arenibacter sp. S6351L]MCK0135594.1 DinB family protein [Arenibacter sp. S6351L]
MKPFVQELFQYTNHQNNAIISAITENHSQISAKTIKLISHIINVHQIWNAKFNLNNTELFDAWTIHEVSDLEGYERLNFDQSIEILSIYKLDQLIDWKTTNGKYFQNSVLDILFQIINHSNYHRAQIATEFRMSGIQPIMTDFILFKMTKPQ